MSTQRNQIRFNVVIVDPKKKNLYVNIYLYIRIMYFFSYRLELIIIMIHRKNLTSSILKLLTRKVIHLSCTSL